MDIGTAEGEAAYQFGQITGIDVGTDSSVYVLDQQARTVRIFDAAGKFVREMGRPGSGPGELGQTAFNVLLGPGDTVFVADMMQPRVNRYGPDGQDAGTIPLPVAGSLSVKWAITDDGMLVHQTRAVPDPTQTEPAASDFLFVRDRSGALRDTLLALPAGKSVQFAGGGMPRIRLFDSEPIWALMHDGKVVFGINTDYSIQLYSSEGQLQRVVRRAFHQRPVTDGDRQAFLEFLEEAWGRAGVPPQV
ncbi:MAG: 6-bladed beta-propeller, partial [Gammaproteobacteria bacterium]